MTWQTVAPALALIPVGPMPAIIGASGLASSGGALVLSTIFSTPVCEGYSRPRSFISRRCRFWYR